MSILPTKSLTFIITLFIASPSPTLSQSSFSSANDHEYSSNNSSSSVTKIEPSVAIVVGVLSAVFSLAVLTLIYVKCCCVLSSTRRLNQESFGNLPRSRSGIDKTIIESLPYFKFSMLKGWTNGLECSVCLSSFEDTARLRLLPKCKHAFHIECIDQWLENHSSCPLCRFKVIEDDIALFMNSNSLTFITEPEPSNLGFFVEREGSSRIIDKDQYQEKELLHKFNHRIMVCEDNDQVMLKTRWSNVSSSDLLFLKSKMITCLSSNRFVHQLGVQNERTFGHKLIIEEPRRSVSDITVHPRFLKSESRVVEENLRRLWLPRRIVERFANMETSFDPPGQRAQNEKTRELLDV